MQPKRLIIAIRLLILLLLLMLWRWDAVGVIVVVGGPNKSWAVSWGVNSRNCCETCFFLALSKYTDASRISSFFVETQPISRGSDKDG